VRDETRAPLSARTSPPSTRSILGLDFCCRPRTLSSLPFEWDATELPPTAWRPGFAPWSYPQHLVLVWSRARYVLDARLRDRYCCGLPPRSMSIQVILPEHVTITPAAVFICLDREKGNGGQRTDRVLRIPVTPAPCPLLGCSPDSFDAASAAYCSRAPLPGSTAPSFAPVVRPPFTPLPRVALLFVLYGVVESLHVTLLEFLSPGSWPGMATRPARFSLDITWMLPSLPVTTPGICLAGSCLRPPDIPGQTEAFLCVSVTRDSCNLEDRESGELKI
jgi:hypothetical protein